MRERHEIRYGGGATLKTLVIGRSPSADVVIADASVAPHHAELVITDDGRLYLTDCATDGGTWVGSDGDLLRWSRGAPADASAGGGAWDGGAQRRVRGPVARDPATGEIVRRRP